MSNSSKDFGTEPLPGLLKSQAIPSSIGILVLSIYGIVDTIFIGNFVGSLGIGAVTVVLPITYLIGSFGMSIGVGGSSIISRSLGSNNIEKAKNTFGNQITLTVLLALIIFIIGYLFTVPILSLFGGKGDILEPSIQYFSIVLIGIPFLAWAMMSNNVIRALGSPKIAMLVLIIPAVTNIILDPIFIVWLDMGIEGAAWATAISYMASALFSVIFFIVHKSELRIRPSDIILKIPIVKEIASIGSVTLARQGMISLLSIVLNNSLFIYGGETGVAVYGIINRLLMFANFPVLGVTQGFVPIVGYNYGAELFKRVASITRLAVKSATVISFIMFSLIMIFAGQLVLIFTNSGDLITEATPAIRIAFLATPLLAISMIGSAFFQATGHAKKALVLALSKQGFFLIPLILTLPLLFGLNGIWMSFPLADFGAAVLSVIYLKKAKVSLIKVPA